MGQAKVQRLLRLLQEEKQMGLKGGLYHQTQIKLAFNSNRIEGSRLSEEQTRYIYEMNTIHVESNEALSVDDIIDNEHKLFYYRGLKEYKAEKGCLTDTCLSAQDRYEKMVLCFFPDFTQPGSSTGI